MAQNLGSRGFFERLATFIVDKRNLILFLYIGTLMFSVVSQGWVAVCNDLTAYLPADTETRRGLTLMEEEFTTYGTARVMVSNVTAEIAEQLADELGGISGVAFVDFDGSAEHFKGTNALFDVTFDGEAEDRKSLAAMDALREALADYDSYISSEVGSSGAETLAKEMNLIMAVAAAVIVLVLLLTSRTYAEIPVLILTFGAAALLNMGTNYWLKEISFVSNSVTVVLQLALSIDYAIILLHRFTEERELHDPRCACINALKAAIPEISASSLTTISGLAAMMFMQYRIGFDLGLVLIKAILFSMLSVFTLMPSLLLLFSNAIDRSGHRNFVPRIDLWGKFVIKTRYVVAPLFCVLLVAGFFLSSQCPYAYGESNLDTARKNESQVAEERISDIFGSQNMLALLVPQGNYGSEKALLKHLESYDEVDYVLGLANTEAMEGYTLTDKLTPRQFSEMTDVDYELIRLVFAAYAADQEEYGQVVSGLDTYAVPLMDMFLFLYDQKSEGYVTLDDALSEELDDMYIQLTRARAQLQGEQYSRLLISLELPEESQETFDFLQTIRGAAARYYGSGQSVLVGNSTSDYDQSVSFARDNVIISVLTVVFVILVLLFTFKSAGLPVLLILIIQGSVWLNFSFPTLTNTPVFFLSYLIVTAIQMGANIDYAIVISSRYHELKQQLPAREAIIESLNLAFPTVLTSGTILAVAGILISQLSSNPVIVGIGACLGRGTIISMVLVMGVLPQILILGDLLVEKTRFHLKMPELTRSANGTIFVDGRVRGRISGVVDATIRGVIHGEVSAIVEAGALSEDPEREEGKSDETQMPDA